MSQELYAGMEKAPTRAALNALGMTEADIAKPLIAVISAASDWTAGGGMTEAVARAVMSGISAEQCTPVLMHACGIYDLLSVAQRGKRYSLPARELVADSVESLLGAAAFDGAVFVGDGDCTVAGMLMGAVRTNVPSVFVTCGPMPSGTALGKASGIDSVRRAIGAVRANDMNIDELTSLEENACPSCGTESVMSSANMLACVLEALGMALPRNGSAPCGSAERMRIAKRAGQAVCAVTREAVTPRMLLGKRAFNNAIALVNALGGNTDVILHIISVAAECNIALDLDYIQKQSAQVPVLAAIDHASGADMRDFDCAGGVNAVMHELALARLVDGSANTVYGGCLADKYDPVEPDGTVIKRLDSAIRDRAAISVITGNLAEGGALATIPNVDKSSLVFNGKARCFNCEEDALAAIAAGKIKKGEAIVVRYEGPAGGPGMRSVDGVCAALAAADLNRYVAVITDGRVSEPCGTLAVCHVTPEAAEPESKLALIADGDAVKIDVLGGKISFDANAKELVARRKKLRVRENDVQGWLLRYRNLVTDAAHGAILKKRF